MRLCSLIALGLASQLGISSAEANLITCPLTKDKVPTKRDLELAEQHYSEGKTAFNAQNWTVSKIEFSAAYLLSCKPELLFNLSLTAEQNGEQKEAISYAEQYLSEGSSTMTQSERDEASGRIVRLRDAPKPSKEPISASAAIPQSAASPSPRTLTIGKFPVGPAILLGIGGASLLAGVSCGIASTIQANHLNNDGPFFPNEFMALSNSVNALNAAGITLDIAGGAALVAGTAWSIVWRLRR